MDASIPPALPTDRHAIGQLLARLLTHFRIELFAEPARQEQFPDIRFAHLQIWGNVGVEGIRLTALAEKANLSLAACSELVNDLESNGYLERTADPSDGRAKLIHPTERGRLLLDAAGHAVARLEQRWRELCEPTTFDHACNTLDNLLRALDNDPQ